MTLLSDCESVANVKIICQDGILLTHKVVVASKNSFLKKIFQEIPVGDTITLFMPDYRQEEVDKNFNELKSNEDCDLSVIPVKTELKEHEEIFEDEKSFIDDNMDETYVKPKIAKKRKKKSKRENYEEDHDHLENKSASSTEFDGVLKEPDSADPQEPALELDQNLSYAEQKELRKKNYEMAMQYVRTA